MNRTSYDTVIIGGGVVGLFTAFHLTEAGFGPLLVLEGGDWATEPCAAGVDAATANYDGLYLGPTFRCLARHSGHLLLDLDSDPELDFQVRPNGLLRVAFLPNELERMAGRLASCFEEPPRGEMVDQLTVRSMEPQLSHEIIGGVWFPEALHLDVPRICGSLAKVLSTREVEILPHCSAIATKYDSRRLLGIRTSSGWVKADRYICCADSRGTLAAGFDLPFTIPAMASQALVTHPVAPQAHTCVAHEIGLTQTVSGDLVATAPFAQAESNGPATERDLDSLLAQAARILPRAADLGVSQAWSRVESQAEDGLPVVGRALELENGYLAIGCSRARGLLAPIIGKLLLELVTNKDASDYLAPLSPRRFLNGSGPPSAVGPSPVHSLQ